MDRINGWYGLWLPAGTPAAIVDRIQQAVARSLAEPAIRARFADLGLLTLGTTPSEFRKFLAQDLVD